jgi:hypothetical protein
MSKNKTLTPETNSIIIAALHHRAGEFIQDRYEV